MIRTLLLTSFVIGMFCAACARQGSGVKQPTQPDVPESDYEKPLFEKKDLLLGEWELVVQACSDRVDDIHELWKPGRPGNTEMISMTVSITDKNLVLKTVQKILGEIREIIIDNEIVDRSPPRLNVKWRGRDFSYVYQAKENSLTLTSIGSMTTTGLNGEQVDCILIKRTFERK